jgi:hypothetical protein
MQLEELEYVREFSESPTQIIYRRKAHIVHHVVARVLRDTFDDEHARIPRATSSDTLNRAGKS